MVGVNNRFVMGVIALALVHLGTAHAVKTFQKSGSGNNFRIVCSLQRLGEVGQMDQKVFGQTYLPNYHFSNSYDSGARYCFFEFIKDTSSEPAADFSCAQLRGTARPAGFEASTGTYSISESGITEKCFVNENGNRKIKALFDLIRAKGGATTQDDIRGLGFSIEFK